MYNDASMAHGALAPAVEQRPAHPAQQPCAHERAWASSDQGSRGYCMMDGIDDMLDLDRLSDEELMEGLFGRIQSDPSLVPIQSCPVEEVKFARLRLIK
jgi:hypothetical protein